MNDDTTLSGLDGLEGIDDTLTRTYTQIVTCIVGRNEVERRRQSLRARLERERYEREQELQNSFISTVRNLFGKPS